MSNLDNPLLGIFYKHMALINEMVTELEEEEWDGTPEPPK
jgi:hypothetical protein